MNNDHCYMTVVRMVTNSRGRISFPAFFKLFCRFDDGLGGDAEMLIERAGWRGISE